MRGEVGVEREGEGSVGRSGREEEESVGVCKL